MATAISQSRLERYIPSTSTGTSTAAENGPAAMATASPRLEHPQRVYVLCGVVYAHDHRVPHTVRPRLTGMLLISPQRFRQVHPGRPARGHLPERLRQSQPRLAGQQEEVRGSLTRQSCEGKSAPLVRSGGCADTLHSGREKASSSIGRTLMSHSGTHGLSSVIARA